MQWLAYRFVHDIGLFGVGDGSWSIWWNVAGWLGNAAFCSRFFVQWYATEKKKQVVVPVLFWWLSLIGSLLLLAYAVGYNKHWVIIFSYAFNWIPYVRNLIIHHRHKLSRQVCPQCGEKCAPTFRFCPLCGAKLVATERNLR